EETIGKSISIIIPPDRSDELRLILESARRGEPLTHYETVRVAKDGRLLNILVSVSPIKDTTGKIVGAASIGHDITERKRAEVILERYRLLSEYTRDILLFIRMDGQIIEANRAAERAYGYSRNELVTLNITDLRPPDEQRLSGEQMREAWEKGVLFETVHRRKDGTLFPVEVSSRGVQIGGDRVLLSIVRDITERKRAEEERKDLMRMVSHDLRNPLTAVLGHAELLQRMLVRSGQDGRMRKSVNAILVGARRMNTMIQDLVDTVRAESRQMTLNYTRLDIRSFVQDLKQRMVGVLDTSRIKVEIPEGLPEVWADADRLERVLVNLLDNGLKYSETEIRVTAAKEDGEIKVSVSDRGSGISPEDIHHLFSRFFRTKEAQEKAGGLGLGLYTTRMLVEAMGGKIWVKSEVGKGSTFTFTLPTADRPQQ
ncbi:MAG: PAS domain S-box protein, partial [Chloroflexota bacterium]